MKYTIERLTEDDVDNFNLTEEEAKNLRVAVKAHKAQMVKRIWRRPDKVVSTIVIGSPGVEIIPNNLRTFLNPRYWLMKLMLTIHFFLYRHVTIGNTRSVIGGRVMMIPLYKGLVDFATDKKKRVARTEADKKMVKDRILGRIQELKMEVEKSADSKHKQALMDVINDALKKNSNN